MQEQQKEIIKKLEYFAYRKNIREVFCEVIEFEALKIALLCDIHNSKIRMQKQKEILNRYNKSDLPKFYEICYAIEKMLVGMIDNFDDYLGGIYMKIGAANKHNQQFFTPMSVGRLMAAINLTELDLSKPIISIGEPACGSGGLLLAVLEHLTEQKINYTDKVLIYANDVDKHCVNMCYLQLSFSGAVAVIKQQNTITQAVVGETFITPAFALQYGKFKEEYEKLCA